MTSFYEAPNKQYWRIRKGEKELYVLCFSWFRAREQGGKYFGTVEGLEMLDVEGYTPVERGTCVVFADEKGNAAKFEVTRDSVLGSIGRGEGIREWGEVERKGGRKNGKVPCRVQKNGQAAVHAQTRDSDSAQDLGAKIRKAPIDSLRIWNGHGVPKGSY